AADFSVQNWWRSMQRSINALTLILDRDVSHKSLPFDMLIARLHLSYSITSSSVRTISSPSPTGTLWTMGTFVITPASNSSSSWLIRQLTCAKASSVRRVSERWAVTSAWMPIPA
ncbi:hypothetical protein PMAYCL1PPCAC_32247, partial [Pristionchus mayeri]